jgi:hypothetical protein
VSPHDDNIDRIKIAAAILATSGDDAQLAAELDDASPAPLTLLISQLIDRNPTTQYRRVFEGICQLRQGRLEDLDSSQFRSYLIRKLDITEEILDACVRQIVTAAKVLRAAEATGSIALSARSEDDQHERKTLPADILRELMRRK